MPIFFQRPENALKRANEFIDVGKKERALDALYDVIKSKKHRTWQKIHEPIMDKYLELCVELKKSHIAKEGLYQYKNICQQVNIKSLEDVVRQYLKMAEQKTEEASRESHQAVVDVDDLDVIASPENLLLSAVSGEDTQDRTDRAILTPWVKFLWESYRQCLDLLRNNSSVEKLYQDIARDAFKFCKKYERKTEFRKLCDNLRTHLGHIHKHQHQHRAINLDDPESQAMHLETRLIQLNSAIDMELWQEAFKGIEDIHGLITKPKKPPKPSLMANYYTKLGLVFWKSGNHLFHACAWHRLYVLSLEQRKNMSQSELIKLSSRVLCATLAIPIPASRTRVDQLIEMDDTAQEKQRRLATLLGMNSPPTRAQLIKDLAKYNIINNVHDDLRGLYNWLEVDFHPLKLSQLVAAPLKFIAGREDLSQYVPALQDITTTRVLKQVSQVYDSIEFSRLAKLAPFADEFRLERIIVDTARNLELQVRINHMKRLVSFGTDLGVASQKEELAEGPSLQEMPSEQVRQQLSHMATNIEKIMSTLVQPQQKSVNQELKKAIMQRYKQVARQEHHKILQRKHVIEERKEELENINLLREQKEIEQAEELRRQQYDAEMKRLEKEAEERERQRRIEERNEIKKKAAKEKLDQLKSTELGAKAFADLREEEIAGMDVDDILAKQVEQLEKEKKELQEKLKAQEKKVDYFERAKRLEEIPMLKAEYENFKIKDKEWFEQQEKERITGMKAEREQSLKQRDRLSRMKPDKDDFLNKLKQDRVSIYKEKLKKFEEKFGEEKTKRLAERKTRRKEERREAWIKAKQEEEQRRIDEELKRKREEEERLAREKREQEEAEYQENLRKLEEQEAKKRAREREVEERQRAADAAARTGGRDSRDDRGPSDRDTWRGGSKDDDSGSSWRPSGKSEGGWRDRVKEKEDSWSKPRDTRDDRRDDRPRGEDTGTWRRGGDRDGGRDDRRDAPPPSRDREDGDRGTWRRGGAREGEERRDDDRWRRDDRREDDRGGDRGGSERWRGGGGGARDDDRAGGWRSAPRDEPRGGGSRDDWKRGGGERGGDRGGDQWRRGGDDRRDDRRDDRGAGGGGGRWGGGRDERPRDGGRWGRDDRGPARDDRGGGGGSGAWRRGGDDKPRDDGGAWRKGGDRAPPRRDDDRRRPAGADDDEWKTVQRS